MKEFREIGDGAAGVAQFLKGLSEIGTKRSIGAKKAREVLDTTTQVGEGFLRVIECVSDMVGERVDAIVNSLQQRLRIIQRAPEGDNGIGEIQRHDEVIRRAEEVGRARGGVKSAGTNGSGARRDA